MKNWQTMKLKDVCQRITVGHVGSMASEYKDSGIPFLRSLNITPFRLSKRELKFIDKKFHDRLKKSALKPGDVAVVRTGYPGTACVIPKELGEANCSDLVLITPGSELNPHFLAAIFNSTFGKNLVGGNLVGAAQQHFNITTAKELKLLLPPKQIQDKIAAILTAYDDLIETNKRRIALLEKMAEEIYREWFVRLRFPGYQNTQFIKGIPEGWEYTSINTFSKFKYGYTESAVQDNELPKFLRVTDINKSSYIDWSNVPNCPIDENELIKYTLGLHDIVIARMADPGQIAIMEDSISAVFASYLIKIDYDRSKITPYYLFYTLSMDSLLEYFRGANSGSTRGSINAQLIGKTKILKPSFSIQSKFEDLVLPIRNQLFTLLQSNQTLTKTRDLLLPRLISGKLPVEHLDIQTPPSMNP